MKADRKKIELAMARACMKRNDIAQVAQMSEASVKNTLYGRNVTPATIGKIAKALGVDVLDIIETK